VRNPLLPVANRSRAYVAKIGASGRFREELTPQLLTAHGRPGEAAYRLRRPPGQQSCNAHSEADREGIGGQPELALLLFEDDLLDGSSTAAADRLGPGDPGVPCIGFRRLPTFGEWQQGKPFRIARTGGRLKAWRMRSQPGARLSPEGCLLGSIVKVHCGSSPADRGP